MIESYEKLSSIGFENVILILLLSLVLGVGYFKAKDYLCERFGIETKRSLKEKKRDEEIEKLKKDYDELSKSIGTLKEDRIHDREQSFQIQKHWTELINKMTEKQDQIIDRVDTLASQTRKYELDDIRENLLQAYRYYTSPVINPKRAWTAMEAHAFWEQFGNYEDRGGNGYMHDTVKPEMNKLIEIPMNDFDKVSELMESRHQNRE